MKAERIIVRNAIFKIASLVHFHLYILHIAHVKHIYYFLNGQRTQQNYDVSDN